MFTFLKNRKIERDREKKNMIIDQIHSDFLTEVDKLLEQAKISKPIEIVNEELEQRANRLQKLGFTSVADVSKIQQIRTQVSAIKLENEQKASLVRAIDYYSLHYPNYKFITEESVKVICKKYNLVYGEVKDYIGTVPEKNLKQIEQFRLREEDMVYKDSFTGEYVNHEIVSFYVNNSSNWQGYNPLYRYTSVSIFGIVAPQKEFNMTKRKIENYQVVIDDPIVLHPVIFDNKKHYLIVTAWGQEASDEIVVNHKMN